MPIPQFHRTPKTRKRRIRRAPPTQERFDVQELEVENTVIHEGASTGKAMELDANCALVQHGSANDEAISPLDDVPALLSSWPPRSK